jgi:plasmid stability protein
MADVLVRDVPEEVLAALDAQASRLGLSRSEYVRRRLAQDAALLPGGVTVNDLAAFAQCFGDLQDPAIMSSAWE